MKTFHYPLGHVWATTLTVGELRAKLAEYPDDLAVFAEWEGQHMPFAPDRFGVAEVGFSNDCATGLVINVD